jgi:rhodanese-related sulfurtransferase
MNTISREELKAKLDGNKPMRVVMALGSWAYNRLHITGSVGMDSLADLIFTKEHDFEVVVYDTNPACPASYRAYYLLKSLGFTNVRRYEGGIEDWMEAGYPVEGSLAGEQAWLPS